MYGPAGRNSRVRFKLLHPQPPCLCMLRVSYSCTAARRGVRPLTLCAQLSRKYGLCVSSCAFPLLEHAFLFLIFFSYSPTFFSGSVYCMERSVRVDVFLSHVAILLRKSCARLLHFGSIALTRATHKYAHS